ncbi:probable E3 ubiquitin-protein ligase DTX2 isoform X1 [Syngnathoides biaculeatus]|uniref:probable E3 ubiquitin-protein ligase DTX2 isoform X1 n=1 Tax=Syngnathoides biaculeatus TaxID=300417 RepID=UPI002ADD6DBD|nr:probable E3 ubiquitin-protein ligase DTX2 isoform X1 [Syngnathoides biaculeatus]
MAIVSGSCARVNVSRSGGPSAAATAPAPSPSSGQSQPMIAVWEWQDDLGHWRPYSGQVSAYIERCLSPRGHRGGSAGAATICLGQSDPGLSPYLIDVASLKQFRQDTGKTRSVRRSLFAQSSGLGSGVYWEWANDEGGWTPYETRTSILLEHSYQARQGTADLGPHGYNYIVDLTSLAQVNKSSGFRRQVRRQCNLPYPLASFGPPAIPSGPSMLPAGVPPPSSSSTGGPVCSCQQCLSHGGTGPMPSRSRHSFSSGSLNRPSLQGTGRVATATAAHPASVYSPYPRRPLSVGGMSWGAPWPPPPSTSQLAAPLLSSSASANGLSIPSIPIQLNGSTSVSSALAGMASILMSAVGLGVHFTAAAPLPQPPPHQHLHQHQHLPPQQFSLPQPPPVQFPPASRPGKSPGSSVKRAKRQHRRASTQRAEEVIRRYMEVVPGVPDEDCIICMDQLSNPSGYETPAMAQESGQVILPDSVGKFVKCGHTLHMLCMLAMYNNGTKDGSLQCPSCKTIYGEKTGTQPKGKMEIYSIPQPLPGHPDCGTIQIIYSIPPGIQGPEHPNPGQPFTCRGFPRFCFLPDSDKGRKVLELLKVAWMRRLIFTVGTSSTTGEPDTVVWNGIHHKTEMMSNLSGHGFPDPNYLDNVLSELASQGVTEDCLKAAGSS